MFQIGDVVVEKHYKVTGVVDKVLDGCYRMNNRGIGRWRCETDIRLATEHEIRLYEAGNDYY